MSDPEEVNWAELPIVCPECGSHGEPDKKWSRYSNVPFKIAEDVVRTFDFTAEQVNGKLGIGIVVDTDDVDWESGIGFTIQCMKCYARFPIPDDADTDFV
ncbi:MAG: hypothetical protein WA208_08360 [Thermoanaerobaculia bacterium]